MDELRARFFKKLSELRTPEAVDDLVEYVLALESQLDTIKRKERMRWESMRERLGAGKMYYGAKKEDRNE